MFLIILLFLGVILGIAATWITSFALLFTRHRRSWSVPVFALPAFLLGSFCIVRYWYDQPRAPYFQPLWLLGAFIIVWWLVGRLWFRSPKVDSSDELASDTRGASTSQQKKPPDFDY